MPQSEQAKQFGYFQKLPVASKLIVNISLLIILVAALLWLLVNNVINKANFTEKESLGVAYTQPLYRALNGAQTARGLMLLSRSGEPNLEGRINQSIQKVDQAFAQLDDIVNETGEELEIKNEYNKLVREWQSIRSGYRALSTGELTNSYSRFVEHTSDLLLLIANNSNLILDPDLDTYYLMEITSIRAHSVAETLGLIRGIGAAELAKDDITTEVRIEIASLLAKLDVKGIQNALATAYRANPDLERALAQSQNQMERDVGAFLAEAEKIKNWDTDGLSATSYFATGTKAIESVFNLSFAAIPEMERIFAERVARHNRNVTLLLVFSPLIMLVCIVLSLYLIRHISRSLREISTTFKSIMAGQLDNHIRISSGDEFGSVLMLLDKTQQKLNRQLAEIEEQSRSANRIKSALDVSQAAVMLVGNSGDVIYANESIAALFKTHQSTFESQHGGFKLPLEGQSIAMIHPAGQSYIGQLSNLSMPHTSRIEVNDLTFDLAATPVFDDANQRQATVLEWRDITEELKEEIKQQTILARNTRISSALDVCEANVLMVNESFEVVYCNDSMQHTLTQRASQLASSLPGLNVSQVMGASLDVFFPHDAQQRRMQIEGLTQTQQELVEIGELTFNINFTPVLDDDNQRLGTVIEFDDLTEQLAKEREEKEVNRANARVRQALDNVATNIMIANAQHDIIYLNHAVVQMMSNAQADIKKALPNFDANNLLHQNIDVFHKNPAHQREMLARLTGKYETEITVGGRTFGLIANPIVGAEGERIGTVVEWTDRTKEVAIEHEVNSLITAAVAGDLSVRLPEGDKEGFFLRLSQGVNSLIDSVDAALADTGNMLDAMAKGDLTKRIETQYQGAFKKLADDANMTAERLTDVVGQILESANAVTSGADEIAQGNLDLSQRTEEQASSLEETASSMEEMTSTVKQSADNAKVASKLAEDTQSKAVEGGAVVNRAVDSMAEINTASKKISDIIGVIDEIAFQTNLLALNAAVEAARAGEQGRGFAVVAGEVRNLAQRSAAAAKEIKDLIRDSVVKVEDGTLLVNESGTTLQAIVDAVKQVADMISDISVASEEQSAGIEQVNRAITQMDEMTQQNASLVEEASAAGEAMAEQANTMRELLGFFAVRQQQGQMRAKPALNKPAAKSPAIAPPKASSKPAAKSNGASGFGASSQAKPAAKQPAEEIKTYSPQSDSDDEEWEDF